jgi:hypothetical protein
LIDRRDEAPFRARRSDFEVKNLPGSAASEALFGFSRGRVGRNETQTLPPHRRPHTLPRRPAGRRDSSLPRFNRRRDELVMDAATLGACRVTTPIPNGTARGVRVSNGSVRARTPVRAVANAGRVCVGRTRAMARGVALGARDAAASRSASWNRAARVTRGAQNIRRATAPNGACFFAIAPAARPSARCRFPTRRKRPARRARDPPVSPTRASDGPGRTISSSPRSRRPSSGTNATTHHRVFFWKNPSPVSTSRVCLYLFRADLDRRPTRPRPVR